MASSSPKELWECLGTAYYKKGTWTKAESAFKSGISVDQNYWRLWECLGNVYYEEGRYAESDQAFARADLLKKQFGVRAIAQKLDNAGVKSKNDTAFDENSKKTASSQGSSPTCPSAVSDNASSKWRVRTNLPMENESVGKRAGEKTRMDSGF